MRLLSRVPTIARLRYMLARVDRAVWGQIGNECAWWLFLIAIYAFIAVLSIHVLGDSG